MPSNKAYKNSQNSMECEILYLPLDVPKETGRICSPYVWYLQFNFTSHEPRFYYYISRVDGMQGIYTMT
jgi:hypothetical protein